MVKNVNITIDSPFEKFLKADKVEVDYEDAEIEEIVDSIPDLEADLPERNMETPIKKKREKKQLKKGNE